MLQTWNSEKKMIKAYGLADCIELVLNSKKNIFFSMESFYGGFLSICLIKDILIWSPKKFYLIFFSFWNSEVITAPETIREINLSISTSSIRKQYNKLGFTLYCWRSFGPRFKFRLLHFWFFLLLMCLGRQRRKAHVLGPCTYVRVPEKH